MTEVDILMDAIQRIIECETIEDARNEAYDALFYVTFSDEEMITL